MKIKEITTKIIVPNREINLFCGDTRIFFIKYKCIKDENLWTFKSCLSYIKSFKAKDLNEGIEYARELFHSFLERFVIGELTFKDDYDEEYCLCKNIEELKQFAKDGGWEDLNDLECELGIDSMMLIKRWFLIIHGRVYFKE